MSHLTNILKITDWEIRRFLLVISSIHIAIWILIGLDLSGVIANSYIRGFIGTIYLVFIPGLVILRAIRLHNLSSIETLLYAVGLSIAFLMFIGFFINLVYPLFGIYRPISLIPMITTISIILAVLCIICYITDRDFSESSYIEIGDLLTAPALVLYLLPILAIVGVHIDNFYNTSIPLMLLIILIAFIAILIAFNRFIPRRLYPLAVITISLALLYSKCLVSPYLVGTPDIQYECYLCQLVTSNSYWDFTFITSTSNTMLSVTILPAIYSILTGMSEMWVFKLVYPTIFSIVPLGLFYALHKQIDERTAFLSTFFFMSLHVFLSTIVGLAKQMIAAIFLILLILLMVSERVQPLKRVALFIIFSASMIVSHYGTSYIFMILLPIVFLLSLLFREVKTTTVTYILLYLVMLFSWYIYVSNAVTFEAVVRIGGHIYDSIYTDFFAENTRDLTLLHWLGFAPARSIWREIGYRTYQITQFFILVGVIKSILKPKEVNLHPAYRMYAYSNMFLLFLVVILPFATNISTSRLYHLTLFFLSPFCIVGGETIFKFILRPSKLIQDLLYRNTTGVLVLIVFIPYLLFSTGFIFEVVNDTPFSISLGLERMKKSDDPSVIVAFNHEYVWEQDAVSAKWLGRHRDKNTSVYRDYEASTILFAYGMISNQCTLSRGVPIKSVENDYIYLRYMNVVNGLMIEPLPVYRSGVYNRYNTTEIYHLFDGKGRIYDNGGAEIYK